MLRGLGVTVDLVRRVVADDPVAVDLLTEALRDTPGGYREINPIGNNVPSENDLSRPEGNTAEKALRRLRREAEAGNETAAELCAEVLAPFLAARSVLAGGARDPHPVRHGLSRPRAPGGGQRGVTTGPFQGYALGA